MQLHPWYKIPTPDASDKRAIIIGGGLSGTSVAYSLAQRGWHITMLEKNSVIAAEASGNPMGIMTPLISHKNDIIGEFYLAGFDYTGNYIHKLKRAGQAIYFNRCGMVDQAHDRLNKSLEELVISDLEISIIDNKNASQIAGVELKSGGMYIPACGMLSPPQLCNAAIAACGGYVQVLTGKNIASATRENGLWIARDISGAQVASAPVMVIASAHDAVKFAQAAWVPLIPVGGQISYISEESLNLKCIICYDGGYATPQINGATHVGATFRRGSIDCSVAGADHITNIRNLCNNIDFSSTLHAVGGRSAIRATTPDRRPVVGAVPDIAAFKHDYADLHHGRRGRQYPPGKYLDGLYISTGHGARGLTSCPISGELLASMINNEPLSLPQKIVDALNPARFIVRGLKRGE